MNNNAGTLFVCGTPIGNLEDITLRQLRILKEADIVACEDTRHTIKLLNHYDIHGKLTSYHEHNARQKGSALLALLQEGKSIALVSDAGMPGISDPGADMIRLCYENNIPVTCVPGPVACVTGLVLSGIDTGRYYFGGFFPKEKKEQEKAIGRLLRESETHVYYEAPHRLNKTLALLIRSLGGQRMASVVKEITKKHEDVVRGGLLEIAAYFMANEPRGEFVLVIAGVDENQAKEESRQAYGAMPVEEHMDLYLGQGIDKKEAMKRVAKDRGVSKSEIYALLNKK